MFAIFVTFDLLLNTSVRSRLDTKPSTCRILAYYSQYDINRKLELDFLILPLEAFKIKCKVILLLLYTALMIINFTFYVLSITMFKCTLMKEQ
jgi:hypothetical protein